MSTLSSAAEKYARKMQPDGEAARNYAAKTPIMPPNWTEGLRRCCQITPGPRALQNYRAGVENAKFKGGKPVKWANNLRSGLSI